jgi:hypothetical protein
MAVPFYTDAADVPMDLGFVPPEIRDAERTELPEAAAAEKPGEGPALGQAGNGRLAGNLRSLTWEVKSLAPNERGGSSVEIKAAGDRILLQCVDYWELYDGELSPVGFQPLISGSQAALATSPAALALDPKRDMLYGPDGIGVVSAWSLRNAKPAYNLAFAFGSDFGKPLLYRDGPVFLTVAVELLRDPHGNHKPDLGVLEARSLEDPLEILDAASNLAASKRLAILYSNTTLLLPALHRETLVLVCKDAYYLANLKLEIKAAFKGEFIPEYLSLDEAGLIHLIVTHKQKRALWVLDYTGRRLMNFPLSAEWGRPIAAPVIGYDHGVILTFEKRVVSVSPLGKKLWDKEYPDGVGGVSVTPDGHVLVAAGREVLALEPQGQRNVLIRILGESLKTRPVMNDAGELLVAGSKALYKLVPKK